MEFTPIQAAEINRLKAYFPYRVIYAAIDATGVFEALAPKDRRPINKMIREGWSVFQIAA